MNEGRDRVVWKVDFISSYRLLEGVWFFLE